ncbi:hypothetical protein QQ008_02105 [Fulvivirgaceae bacterium BMA10]|uniref:Uncharacterized protein n=1 Tax=Splendidivirga corallicola TaxID=3051826 RepID=A0ABT8KHD0_9BACT|nr:hypothetical protein [Fulvivirgaceae bacterium BMA10]
MYSKDLTVNNTIAEPTMTIDSEKKVPSSNNNVTRATNNNSDTTKEEIQQWIKEKRADEQKKQRKKKKIELAGKKSKFYRLVTMGLLLITIIWLYFAVTFWLNL